MGLRWANPGEEEARLGNGSVPCYPIAMEMRILMCSMMGHLEGGQFSLASWQEGPSWQARPFRLLAWNGAPSCD